MGFFIFGFLVLSLWFVLSSQYESVQLEILSIIGWVAVWEATSILLIGNQELRQTKRNYDKMLNAEIIITTE